MVHWPFSANSTAGPDAFDGGRVRVTRVKRPINCSHLRVQFVLHVLNRLPPKARLLARASSLTRACQSASPGSFPVIVRVPGA